MHVRAVMVYREGHVGYLVPLRQEHPLVERLHLVQSFVCFDKTRHSTVQVRGGSEDGEIVLGGDGHRIFMKEAAVSLEMDDSTRLQELTVPLQEQWTGQTTSPGPKKASMNSILVLRKATLGSPSSVAVLAPLQSLAPFMSTPM